MGKFEGVLLCTDLDGTLAIGKDIPERNRRALSRFMAEGGMLSLCPGRGTDYLMKMEGVLPNAPYISCNGTEIYDGKAGKLLWQKGMEGADCFRVVEYLKDRGFSDIGGYCYFSDGSSLNRGTPLAAFDTMCGEGKTVLKIVYIFPDKVTAAQTEEDLKKVFPCYTFTRSWPEGVEQIHPEAGKGVAVQLLKQRLGARTLVCIGDEEIDHSMLRAADLAFAPANATEETKRLAREVLCPVEEGALMDLIDVLPRYLQ